MQKLKLVREMPDCTCLWREKSSLLSILSLAGTERTPGFVPLASQVWKSDLCLEAKFLKLLKHHLILKPCGV